ncbi:MAG: restriction endonuclease subunit S [Verrucomicrobia bacterium]|nr:restriction endonuclease subunit S [Verrucomicrobiota bacterium]
MSSKTKTNATKEEATPALVPKLRFPEFRGAGAWKMSCFDEALSPVVRERPKPAEAYLGLGLRSHGKGTFLKPLADPAKISMDQLYEVKTNDLIVNITFAWEGAVAIAQECDEGALVSHRFPTYTFEKGRTTPEFFRYIILDKQFIYNLGVISPGGAGRNRVLSKNDFLKLRVALPSPVEQKKIAECLSSVDELIAAHARKLDTLKTHKKGLMQQLFPREGETQPHLRFPEFQTAGEWASLRLSDLIQSLDAGVSVNSDDRPAATGEAGVLKTSAVTYGIFAREENKVVLDEFEIGRLRESVCKNTVIISRMNTPELVGANAYVEASAENIFLPDRLWAAKSSPGASMRFIACVLGSDKGRAALSKLATGSSGSMKNITKPDVLSLQVMAPTLEEQDRIATCVSSLDALIAAQTQKLEALKTHKKGLMQQLFPSLEEVEA